jgi:aryl carrier-like protein
VDRSALPEVAPGADRPYVAPRDELEELIAHAWARELGLARVGREDNFFSLGGHSLRASRVVAHLRKERGVHVPLGAVFQAPTLAEFADTVRVSAEGAGEEIRRRPDGEPAPLSAAQVRLWFLYNLDPGRSDYNSHAAFRLRGPLDEHALATAFGFVAGRHEILSSGVGGRIDAPVLVPARQVEAEQADVSDVDAALAAATRFAEAPFDVARGPLARALVVRVAPDEHVFVVAVHHMAVDGSSMPVLWAELAAAYAAFTRGEVPALPEIAVRYGDFAYWQRNWLAGGVLARQLDHWRGRLAGLTPAEIPPDRPRAGTRSARGAVVELNLPADLSARLRAFAAEQGVTLFMVLLAGFHVVQARHTGQTDLTVGTPIAGRGRAELTGMIGFFVNTLVLRTDLSGEPTFTEVVARTRATAVDAYANADVPFEKLVEELTPPRDQTSTPFFQVMFSLDENDHTVPEFAGLTTTPVTLPVEHAKFDLSVSLGNHDDHIGGTIGYAADLFTAATVERLAADYVRVLADALSTSDEQPPWRSR